MANDDFVNMIKQLQKKIEHEEEKKYSKIVISEYHNPTNFGVIEHPNSVGIIKGPCGDTMKITLKIVYARIMDARFWTNGCGATLAAGNMLTKMAIGKTLQEANNLTAINLVDALGGLPKEHSHCAVLAVNTLNRAINKYKNRGRK